MADGDLTNFSIQVNGGPEQQLRVSTGLYISAAAAVPAVLGIEDFPISVRIWVPDLQPDYPPLTFWIEEAGAAAVQDLAACAKDWLGRFANA